jgi:molybdopterin synthase catalytic subunit
LVPAELAQPVAQTLVVEQMVKIHILVAHLVGHLFLQQAAVAVVVEQQHPAVAVHQVEQIMNLMQVAVQHQVQQVA